MARELGCWAFLELERQVREEEERAEREAIAVAELRRQQEAEEAGNAAEEVLVEDLGLPPFLELTLAKPKFFEDLTDAEFREILGSRLRAVTLAIRRDRRRRGLSVRSPGAIVNTDWRQVPAAEPEDVCRRAREDSPFRGALELCRQAERALEEFREAYRIARDRWRSGDHTVVFPRGTDALRRRHGARIAPAA